MIRKTTFAPHLGREVRLGGCDVRHLGVRHALAMSHVVRAGAIPIPKTTNFAGSPAVAQLVSRAFLNNELGDCVIAARAHRIGLLTGNATGSSFLYTDEQVDVEYGRVGGYVVGDPSTDNGCDPTVSADDAVKNGYADGSRDAGWVSVDATDWAEVMLANYVTCGACDLSMALPDAWVSSQMPHKNGDVWDVAGDPDPRNGHNVAVVDHDAQRGLLVDTWGLLVWITPAAVAKYGSQANDGMLIAHVNQDAVSATSSQAPNGLDWTTLLTYFDRGLGASVPLVRPQPTAPVTLTQAQAWASNGVHQGPSLMTKSSAAAHASAGLAAGWPRS